MLLPTVYVQPLKSLAVVYAMVRFPFSTPHLSHNKIDGASKKGGGEVSLGPVENGDGAMLDCNVLFESLLVCSRTSAVTIEVSQCGRIVIAGGGLGGAAIAVALQSKGFEVASSLALSAPHEH
eukprot:436480-Amphidinium_carterae.1